MEIVETFKRAAVKMLDMLCTCSASVPIGGSGSRVSAHARTGLAVEMWWHSDAVLGRERRLCGQKNVRVATENNNGFQSVNRTRTPGRRPWLYAYLYRKRQF